MAVVAEEKKDETQQTQAPVTGGAGPTTQAGAGRLASYSTGNQPSAKGSGRFTNLQSYIKANEGAGQQLGSKIGTGLEKEVKKAGDTTQAQNIGQQVQAEKDRLAQGQQFKTQLGEETGAQNIAGNEQTAKQFSNLLNNQNVASNLMQQAQTAQSQQNAGLQQAQQNVQQLSTEAGRFNLLKGTVKNPNYTSGQQRLDQLFLQAGSPQQLVDKQRELTGQIGQTSKNLESLYGQLGTDIGAAGTQAEETAKMLRGELGTQTSLLTAAQRKEAEDINKQNALRNTALETYFKSGLQGVQDPEQQKYVQQMLESGGLQSGMRTYNVLKEPDAYKKFATLGDVNYTAADVLSNPEFQRYSALQKLAEATTPGEFTQAGKGATSTEFKGQDLANAITGARSQLETDLNKNYTGTGYYNDPNLGSGKSYFNVATQANLLDTLKQKESNGLDLNTFNPTLQNYEGLYGGGKGNAAIRFNSDAANTVNPEDVVYNPTKFASHVSGTELYNRANAISKQNLYQQFLDRLNAAGYENTLGGVTSPTPTNKFGVK